MATLYAYSPNGTQATLPVNIQGFTQSLSTSGWTKLPNGLLFQWAQPTLHVAGGANSTTSFPITFPNICICIWRQGLSSGQGNVFFGGRGSKSRTTSSFTRHFFHSSTRDWVDDYFAIGY